LIYLPNKNKPFSGKNLCKYENGQNKSKGKIKDGKKNDVWTEWEENGQIKLERTYNFDQILREKNYQNSKGINDTSFSFNEKGLLEIKGHYKDGNLVGETKFLYNENDQIKKESNFKFENLISYTGYSYYENGQRRITVNYRMGKKHGRITEWFENGQIKSEENYKNGKNYGKYIEWYENGQKKLEANYIADMIDGKLTEWHDNGQIRTIKEYHDEYLTRSTGWTKSGNIKFKRTYKRGICVSGDCD
jgi:antitoxin component YwqK of YwqJK toxin-antitoxin module